MRIQLEDARVGRGTRRDPAPRALDRCAQGAQRGRLRGPRLKRRAGPAAARLTRRLGPTSLLALGGLLYWAGAAVYALRRPDRAPAVFGYHEVFHALVIAAAVTHYAVFALYVLPRA